MNLHHNSPNLNFWCFPVAGLVIPQPKELKVAITDGEVVVHWKPPADAPTDVTYNVQMGKYV